MHRQRAIASAADVVLAAPQVLDRSLAPSLGDRRGLARELGIGRTQAAEAAAGKHGVDFDLLGLDAQCLRDDPLVAGDQLASHPDLGPVFARFDVFAQFYHRAHRLHRGVGEEREAVLGFDPLCRRRQASRTLSAHFDLDPRRAGGFGIDPVHLVARAQLRAGAVPLGCQRGDAPLGRPPRVGDDHDAAGNPMYREHARDRLGRSRIERLELRPEGGRVEDRAVNHARSSHIGGILCRSVGFGRAADDGQVAADQPERGRILQLRLRRERQLGGGLG